ncbi:integrase catalytic domain-containing protein [Trichonephila inaurata madagascariensis]|uniref:Integrase catalytic domain-containing protein n=1 Tax=Trichonephila inaurata madagascariensis TaxID=2747483 RepID=A0A8X6WUI4_9ARAC|nr:integrase catalytic domain-containing protein [Trichonephila inaurata madagascariensis]
MADDVISRLKKCRGIVRLSVTKQIKSIETELRNETPYNLEELIEILKEFAIELESLDNERHKIIDPKQLEADVSTAIEYREKITTWKFRANKKLNSLRISTPNETTHKITQFQSEITLDSSLKNALENMFQEKVQINLPKLSIKKFYGEMSQWLTFWNSFESAIHKNTSLDKISKFNYLKAFLGGTALQTVEGFAITSANYDSAIEMLENRFGNKEILIKTYMNRILNIPPLKNSNDIKSFRKAIYDSGSKKSYVSKFVAESLKLKCMGKESVNHGLFGGIVKKENHRIYCLKLSKIDKSFSLNVNVMDQEKICVPLAKFHDISSVIVK